MKSISYIGIILLVLATGLFYLTTDFSVEQIRMSHIMGIMAGIGIGLFVGGIVGYTSKGRAIKKEEQKRAFKQLQKEKLELEKQAQELKNEKEKMEARKQEPNFGSTANNNPQNY